MVRAAALLRVQDSEQQIHEVRSEHVGQHEAATGMDSQKSHRTGQERSVPGTSCGAMFGETCRPARCVSAHYAAEQAEQAENGRDGERRTAPSRVGWQAVNTDFGGISEISEEFDLSRKST